MLPGPEEPGHSCRAPYRCARPPARPVRPRGPESSPLQHIEHASQCLPIEDTADADTVLAGDINLDLLRNGRWRRRCARHVRAAYDDPSLGSPNLAAVILFCG